MTGSLVSVGSREGVPARPLMPNPRASQRLRVTFGAAVSPGERRESKLNSDRVDAAKPQ